MNITKTHELEFLGIDREYKIFLPENLILQKRKELHEAFEETISGYISIIGPMVVDHSYTIAFMFKGHRPDDAEIIKSIEFCVTTVLNRKD